MIHGGLHSLSKEDEVEEGGEVALVHQEDLMGNNMEETRMGTLPARGPSLI